MEKDPKNDSSDYDVDYGECEINFKIIVVGDSGVGKTCITSKAIKGIFDVNYSPTIGFEFFTYIAKVEDKNIKLQIWDTCGQEVYKALIGSFYRNSSLAILVYSIDAEESFNSLKTWINEIKTQSNPDIKIVLIGNKIDLEDEGKRKLTKEMGEKFCNDNKLAFFLETSAKTGTNTEKLFNEVARILYEKHKEMKEMKNQNVIPPYQQENKETITLQSKKEEKDKDRKKCFC